MRQGQGKIFPCIDMRQGQAIDCVKTVTFVLPFQLYVISFPLLPHADMES